MGTAPAPTLATPAPGGTGPRGRRWGLIPTALALIALLIVASGALSWTLLRDPGAASLPEILGVTPEEPSEKSGQKPAGPEEVKVPGVEGSTEQ